MEDRKSPTLATDRTMNSSPEEQMTLRRGPDDLAPLPQTRDELDPLLEDSQRAGHFEAYQRRPISEVSHISPLLVLYKVRWILSTLVCALALFVYQYGLSGLLSPPSELAQMHLLGLRAGLAVLLVSLLYWELHRQSHSVEVNGFRLEVSTGIFWKVRASTHLLPHTNFLIKRNSWFEILFGLASLQVLPVNTPDPEIVNIPMLPLARAQQLKSYLGHQIDKQIGINVDCD